MDRRDFSDLEDQIMSTVKNAFNAIDFANLKRDISFRAEDTINEFKSKFNEYNQKIESKYNTLNKKAKNNISLYIAKRPAGSISGIIYIILGLTGSVVFGFLALMCLIFVSFFTKIIADTFIGVTVTVKESVCLLLSITPSVLVIVHVTLLEHL